jgi:hypothetical protein
VFGGGLNARLGASMILIASRKSVIVSVLCALERAAST